MSDAKSGSGHVLVVGSLNVDLVMRVARLPHPGETVTGAAFEVVAGGKGANQAAAAARLGAAVRMIGRVGADSFGERVRAALATEGVEVTDVRIDCEVPTGTAHVVVDASGQNAIVVASGANARVAVADAIGPTAAWNGAALVVLQLEIPLVTVAATVANAVARGVPVLLNAAPAQRVPADLLRAVQWLIVNEVEAAQLIGADHAAVRSPTDAVEAARRLQQGDQQVLVTLGAAGAVWLNGAVALHVPAPTVAVADTTAAGDALVGALAAALARGANAEAAVRQAVVAGSLACTKPGALRSLPTVEELAAAEGRHTIPAASMSVGSRHRVSESE